MPLATKFDAGTRQILGAPRNRLRVDVAARDGLARRRNQVPRETPAATAEVEDRGTVAERAVDATQQALHVPEDLAPDAQEVVGIVPAADADTQRDGRHRPQIVQRDERLEARESITEVVALRLELRDSSFEVAS